MSIMLSWVVRVRVVQFVTFLVASVTRSVAHSTKWIVSLDAIIIDIVPSVATCCPLDGILTASQRSPSRGVMNGELTYIKAG